MDTKQAFGYIRVSSAGQADDGRDGIPRQRQAIERWAKANGVSIARWFIDSVSGKTDLDNRPELRELLTALHANGIRTVIVENLSRLARDLMIQESIVADFQRNGFELISTTEPDLCSAEPTRVLLRQMMGAFSQYERTMIVMKLRGARERARAKNPNYREGRRPFGSRSGEAGVISQIQQLRTQGMSVAGIAKHLNDAGVHARAGHWHATSVQRILQRQS